MSNSHIKNSSGGLYEHWAVLVALCLRSTAGVDLCYVQYRWTCAAKRNALDSHFPVKTSAANGGKAPQGFWLLSLFPCQSTDYAVQENLCMWKECLESHWKDRVLAIERNRTTIHFCHQLWKVYFVSCWCEGLHGNSLIWCPSNVIDYFWRVVPELWWTFLPKEITNPVCLPLNCRNIIKSPQ